MTNTSTTNISGIKNLLRALRSRNYRLFLAGQSVSMVGTWMQQVAMSWLVYRITGSAFLLGVVGAVMFARNLPNIREKVLPIYVKMGIIKEVADGIENGH